MRQLVTAFILAMCLAWSSIVSAQSKRVFFFEAGNSMSIDSAKDAITSVFTGEIVSGSALPADLSSFDLIYVYGNPDQTSHIRLVDHLKNDGKVFLDAYGSSGPNGGDSLLTYLGLRVFGLLTAVISEGVAGRSGTFAAGFAMDDPTHNGFMSNLDQTQRADDTQMQLVLAADGPSHLAWMKEEGNALALIFMPQVSYYYKPFIRYAVCNYFQLCTMGVDDGMNSELTISYDPSVSMLTLPFAGSVTISDLLGRVVLSDAVSHAKYQLPSSLANGHYIVRWHSESAHASTKISVF
jgi:hypothetical protein